MRKLFLGQLLNMSDLGLEDVRSFRDVKIRRSSLDLDLSSSGHSTSTPPKDGFYGEVKKVECLTQYLMDCVIPVAYEEYKSKQNVEKASGSSIPTRTSSDNNGLFPYFHRNPQPLTHYIYYHS